MIHSLLGVIGPTCSGKSTISGIIENLVPVNVVSFGKYLFNYSLERSHPTDKPSLQNLGNSFIQKDPNEFLKNVLNYGMNGQKIVLIEGIRHKSIFTALKEISSNTYFIYVYAESHIRHSRYCQRNNYSPENFPFEKFESMESHVVESEIESLKPFCESIIDNNNIDIDSLKSTISTILSKQVNFLRFP